MASKDPNRIRSKVSYQGNVVWIHYGKGTGDEWQEVASKGYDLDKIPQDVQRDIALYGLNKLLSDRTSDKANDVRDSKDPSPRLEAMDEVYNLFLSGSFKQEKAKAGKSGGVPLIAEAIAEYKGVSVAKAHEAWKKQTDEQKEKIKANEEIQEIVERMQEERKEQGEVDLSDLGVEED